MKLSNQLGVYLRITKSPNYIRLSNLRGLGCRENQTILEAMLGGNRRDQKHWWPEFSTELQ